MKVFVDCENPNKCYVELPDGYRLIYIDGEYAGRYDANLSCVI